MRQFKFKAFHEKTERMRYFYLGDEFIDFTESKYFTDHISPKNPELKIMQYLGTDCKDEDGRELCEGDIYRTEFDLPELGAGSERTCVIVFKFGEFLFKNLKEED